MKIFDDYRKIKDFNSEKQLIAYYKNNKNPAFLNIMKYSGKMINPYPGEFKYKEKLFKITKYIDENCVNDTDKNEWNKVIKQSQMINDLYKSLYDNPNYKTAESVPPHNALASYLIALEYTLSTIINNLFDNVIGKNEIPISIDIDSVHNQNFVKELRMINTYDHLCYIGDSILRYLVSHKCKSVQSNKKTNKRNTCLSLKHNDISDLKTVIQGIEKNWEFFEMSVEKKGNDFIFFINDKNYIDYKIIQIREQERINNLQVKNVNNLYKKLDYNQIDKKLIQIFMQAYLFTDDITSICIIKKDNKEYKIDIESLIIAFNSLKNCCTAFKNNYQKYTFNLKEVCPVLKRETIIHLFIDAGITSIKAHEIFNILLLNGKYDFFDNPIIPFNKEFALVPSAVESINVIPTILSLVNRFEFRGDAFENKIIRLLERNNIIAKKIIRSVDGTTYECDVVFIIDNVLFFCECKAWGMIKSQHDYYEYCIKVNSAKEQLDRIVGYFSKNLDFVKSKLDYQYNIKEIRKLIITSNSIGINNYIDDTHLIDSFSLNAFLNREGPKIIYFTDKKKIEFLLPGFNEYRNEITISKIDTFLDHPASVEIVKANLKKERRVIKIETKNIKYDDYELKYDINSNTDEYIEMLEEYFTNNKD